MLVVRSYETSTKRVLVGARFKLTLDIDNATAGAPRTSSSRCRVVRPRLRRRGAAGDRGGLTVLGSGNAKFLGTIKGKERSPSPSTSWSLPAPPAGTYTVPVTVRFEYNGARQEMRRPSASSWSATRAFSMVTAELPERRCVGETFDASFEMANASGFALSGVTLSVEATGVIVTDGLIFLGAMDAARTEVLDVQITPEKAGELEVAFVVTYRDDFGVQQEFREARTVEGRGRCAPRTSPTRHERRGTRGRAQRQLVHGVHQGAVRTRRVGMRFRDLAFLVVSNLRRDEAQACAHRPSASSSAPRRSCSWCRSASDFRPTSPHRSATSARRRTSPSCPAVWDGHDHGGETAR